MTDAVDPPPTTNRWWQYIEEIREARGHKNVPAFAAAIGVPAPTIYGWKNTRKVVDATTARKVAHALDRPVIEAFVNAGLLTWDEVERTTEMPPQESVRDLSKDALLAELNRRLTEYEQLQSDTGASAEKPKTTKTGTKRKTPVGEVARRAVPRS